MKSISETTPAGDVTELIVEVFRLNRELLEAGDALVADIGLTSARWQVLGAIALSPVPLPVAHLARNMGLTRQSVRRLVGEMLVDRLVRYSANPHHRRAELVLLTERGKAAYRAAMDRQRPWAAGLASDLSPKAIRAATGVLRTLRRRFDDSPAEDARLLDLHQTEGDNNGTARRNG